jgi:hypothetical protein
LATSEEQDYGCGEEEKGEKGDERREKYGLSWRG